MAIALKRTTNPVHELPPNYREAHYLKITAPGLFIALNVLAIIPMVALFLILSGVLLIYHEAGAPFVISALPTHTSSWIGLAIVLVMLPLHEWIHGLAIEYLGHKARYGVKWVVLYATSDGALFRRNEFILVALAPLVVITLIGMILMLFLPAELAYWIVLAVALNAAGAIGDIWMTVISLRYDTSAVIEDEADSMRIYTEFGEQHKTVSP